MQEARPGTSQPLYPIRWLVLLAIDVRFDLPRTDWAVLYMSSSDPKGHLRDHHGPSRQY